ncbi:MAG: Gp15 family bacteriophage protein [Aminipila sp.]
MDIITLAESLEVCGKTYKINSDFRPCLGIMQTFENNDITEAEKLIVLVGILFKEEIPAEHFGEAVDKALCFLDGGQEESNTHGRDYGRLYSWKQDIKYILSAVDLTLNISSRSQTYMHWWIFLSALMECKECTFSTLIHQRKLKKIGKQEKYDKEWWAENREIAELKLEIVLTQEEMAAVDKFNKLMG